MQTRHPNHDCSNCHAEMPLVGAEIASKFSIFEPLGDRKAETLLNEIQLSQIIEPSIVLSIDVIYIYIYIYICTI